MLRPYQALADLSAVFPRRKQRYTEEVQKHGREELRLPLIGRDYLGHACTSCFQLNVCVSRRRASNLDRLNPDPQPAVSRSSKIVKSLSIRLSFFPFFLSFRSSYREGYRIVKNLRKIVERLDRLMKKGEKLKRNRWIADSARFSVRIERGNISLSVGSLSPTRKRRMPIDGRLTSAARKSSVVWCQILD